MCVVCEGKGCESNLLTVRTNLFYFIIKSGDYKDYNLYILRKVWLKQQQQQL